MKKTTIILFTFFSVFLLSHTLKANVEIRNGSAMHFIETSPGLGSMGPELILTKDHESSISISHGGFLYTYTDETEGCPIFKFERDGSFGAKTKKSNKDVIPEIEETEYTDDYIIS